nr:MAG TPA: hypothetical protein [Caudoviricetes sp.]
MISRSLKTIIGLELPMSKMILGRSRGSNSCIKGLKS